MHHCCFDPTKQTKLIGHVMKLIHQFYKTFLSPSKYLSCSTKKHYHWDKITKTNRCDENEKTILRYAQSPHVILRPNLMTLKMEGCP